MIDEFPKMKRFFIDDPRHQEFAVALVLACRAAGPELRVLVMNRDEKPKVEIVLPTTPQTVHEVDLTPTQLVVGGGGAGVNFATPAVTAARAAASKRGKR